ncbi:hypothetical protein LAD77_01740 [Klebsiella pneumoniae]|nr:hypothetical protein [Klebsiella pneumoniae]
MRGAVALRQRTLEIAKISRSLKGCAKRSDRCVVALSQLNRCGAARSIRRTVNSDLRDPVYRTGADFIMSFKRAEVSQRETAILKHAELSLVKAGVTPFWHRATALYASGRVS